MILFILYMFYPFFFGEFFEAYSNYGCCLEWAIIYDKQILETWYTNLHFFHFHIFMLFLLMYTKGTIETQSIHMKNTITSMSYPAFEHRPSAWQWPPLLTMIPGWRDTSYYDSFNNAKLHGKRKHQFVKHMEMPPLDREP